MPTFVPTTPILRCESKLSFILLLYIWFSKGDNSCWIRILLIQDQALQCSRTVTLTRMSILAVQILLWAFFLRKRTLLSLYSYYPALSYFLTVRLLYDSTLASSSRKQPELLTSGTWLVGFYLLNQFTSGESHTPICEAIQHPD